MAIDKNHIKEYIESKGDEYPSFEDFLVWGDLNAKFDMFGNDDLGEYKGYITTFSKRWLNNAIALGGRRSMGLVSVLRELNANDVTTSTGKPVTIIEDLPKQKKGGRVARSKIK